MYNPSFLSFAVPRHQTQKSFLFVVSWTTLMFIQDSWSTGIVVWDNRRSRRKAMIHSLNIWVLEVHCSIEGKSNWNTSGKDHIAVECLSGEDCWRNDWSFREDLLGTLSWHKSKGFCLLNFVDFCRGIWYLVPNILSWENLRLGWNRRRRSDNYDRLWYNLQLYILRY